MFRLAVRKLKRPGAAYTAAGACLGVLISFLVAAVMLEISENHFFATYFGVLFLIIGLAIVRRVTLSHTWSQGGKLTRLALGLFACIMLLSSVSCFIVDHNVLKLSHAERIPFFLFLGIAVSFAITFALMDVLNAIFSVINSSKQMLVILASSITSGAIWGLIYGILDSPNNPPNKHILIQDEKMSAPLGLIIGSIAGYVTFRLNETRPANNLFEAPYAPVIPEDDGS